MSELSDSRRRALDALVDARDKLEAGGFQTDLSETVGLENGGLVIKLVVKGQTRRVSEDDALSEVKEMDNRPFEDSINAKRGYGWDVNPWVWVVEVKVLP